MKTTTWSNVGKSVKGNNVNEIILEAGLDYEVIKEPIYTGAGLSARRAKVEMR